MPTSRCAHCESRQFELKEAEPRDSRFKLMFIQCASCGRVVGVTDAHNVPNLIHRLARKLGVDLSRG